MNPNNTVIVISCYRRPTEWADRLKELGYEVRRYTKEDPTSPYNVELNVGMEASTYLKYCCDSYSRLPEYTVFLHDEEFSWHHEGSIIDRITEAVGWSGKYRTLNNSHNLPYFYCENNGDSNVKRFYDDYLLDYIGPLEQFGEFMGPTRIGAAQMIVHQDAILARPVEMYGRIYSLIMSRYGLQDAAKECGILLEYFWGIIFGDVEPINWSERAKICVVSVYEFPYTATYCRQAIDFFIGGGSGAIDLTKYSWFIQLKEPLQAGFNFDFFYTKLSPILERQPNSFNYVDHDGESASVFTLVRIQ